jgi:hypothetical protein
MVISTGGWSRRHVEEETARRLGQREAARDDGDDGEAVGDERGAVVDEALALDQRDQPAGKTQSSSDRGSRCRVRGRDDRSEHEGLGPAEAGDHGVGDDRDRQHRGQHEADGEERDRANVRAELPQRREEGRPVQEGRQDRDQHEVGSELDARHAGHESEPEASEDEQDGVGNPDQLGHRQERRSRRQQPHEDQAVLGRELHAGPSSPASESRFLLPQKSS